MVFYRMGFGEVVCKIVLPSSPKDAEAALPHPVAYPVEPLVDGFAPFALAGIVGNAVRNFVVCLYECLSLCMS